jgi:hypothetical protein
MVVQAGAEALQPDIGSSKGFRLIRIWSAIKFLLLADCRSSKSGKD